MTIGGGGGGVWGAGGDLVWGGLRSLAHPMLRNHVLVNKILFRKRRVAVNKTAIPGVYPSKLLLDLTS